MPDVWPPPPANQPRIEPPAKPRSGEGLEALVLSVAAAVLLLILTLILPPHGGNPKIPAELLGVVYVSCWISAMILGLMDWKTRFGPMGLLVCVAQVTAAVVFDPK